MRARLRARHDDCFVDCVEHGRTSSDILGLLKVRVRKPTNNTPLRGSTALWSTLPAVRPGRLIVGGKRMMHMQFSDTANRSAADFDRYITQARDGSATKAELVSDISDASVAADFDRYATRDRTASDDQAASGDRPDGQVFTNIPGTSQQRRAFWNYGFCYEVSLHKPGPDRINFKRDECQDFLKHLSGHNRCPPDLRDFATCTGRHTKAGKKLDKRRAKVGTPYITNEARNDYDFLCAEFAKFAPDQVRPFTFSPARQLQTERNGDFELPPELNAAAHQRILRRVAAKIEAYATRAERKVGLPDGRIVDGRLPVLMAYHPPDADNNELNNHGHFQFHDRAFAIDDDGSVHFAKIKCAVLTRHGMMKLFRSDVAIIINEELAAANKTIRVTTASLADLGSDATPQLKLGKGLQRLEADGVVTDKGLHNRVVSWNRPYQENIDHVADRQRELAADNDALRCRIASAAGLSSADRQQLDDERRKVLRLRTEALEAEETARYATFVIEMAESNLMARGEKASRKKDFATTRQQENMWHNAIRDIVIAHGELYDELKPELATRDQAQAAAYASAAEGTSRRTALIDTMDAMIERARLLEQARVDAAKAAEAARARRLSDLHRVVDTIDRMPLALTRLDGKWAVAAADDPGRVVARFDLSEPEIQVRLQGVADTHVKERGVAVAWLCKHGHAAAHEELAAQATDYVRKQLRRWQNNAYVVDLVDQRRVAAAVAATAVAAPVAPRVVFMSDEEEYVPVAGLRQINAFIYAIRGTTQRKELAKRAAIVRAPKDDFDRGGLAKVIDAGRSVNGAVVTVNLELDAMRGSLAPRSDGRIVGDPSSVARTLASKKTQVVGPSATAVDALLGRMFHHDAWERRDYRPVGRRQDHLAQHKALSQLPVQEQRPGPSVTVPTAVPPLAIPADAFSRSVTNAQRAAADWSR